MSTKPLIIITGASSGIGEASAKLFSKRGYPLLLLARRIERLEALKLPNTLCRKVDVTDFDSFQKAVLEAEQKFGPTDMILNNAGVMLLSEIRDQDPKEWKTMLDANVLGVMNGSKIVLNGMIARKGGSIINVSSVAGRKTFSEHAAYCATKFAVHAFTENLRSEVAAHGVRCIVIAPGIVETELLGHTTSAAVVEDYQQFKKTLTKVLASEDIADAILYAYEAPAHVCIRELVIAPTTQAP